MVGGVFFQPRYLEHLSPTELDAYERHCEQRIVDASVKLAWAEGQLEGLSKGLRKKKWLLAGGTALGAAGMVGLAIFTWGGALALAGGGFTLLSLDDFAADAREREMLRIDLRNLNESVLFHTTELERLSAERARRGL